jgi:hypothetical protein
MSHSGNDEIIDNERDNLTINPKDYPNVSGLFGNYQKEQKIYKIITKANIYEEYTINANTEKEAKQIFNDQGWDEESKILTIENEEIVSITTKNKG